MASCNVYLFKGSRYIPYLQNKCTRIAVSNTTKTFVHNILKTRSWVLKACLNGAWYYAWPRPRSKKGHSLMQYTGYYTYPEELELRESQSYTYASLLKHAIIYQNLSSVVLTRNFNKVTKLSRSQYTPHTLMQITEELYLDDWRLIMTTLLKFAWTRTPHHFVSSKTTCPCVPRGGLEHAQSSLRYSSTFMSCTPELNVVYIVANDYVSN